MTRHVHIDRLELDLRGLPPATAQAAVRQLGPALQRALVQAPGSVAGSASTAAVDAGRLRAAADTTPAALATQLAGRIGSQIRGGRS